MNNFSANAKLDAGLSKFFSKVYAFVALGIGVSAITSFALLNVFPNVLIGILSSSAVFWGLWILEIALVIAMGRKAFSNPSFTLAGFLVYSMLNGITISATLLVYAKASVVAGFVSAAVTFVVMALVGMTTKKDLSAIGRAALSALIGVIVAMLINVFFLKSTGVELFISMISVLIFSALTAYDNQKLKAYYYHYGETESITGIAIFSALQLYLDFINLFLSFVRIFASRD